LAKFIRTNRMGDDILFVIDRFEEDWAVIEYGKKTFNFPRVLLPEGVGEGDAIRILVQIKQKAEVGKKEVEQLMGDLFKG
jgi:hypothetical protein